MAVPTGSSMGDEKPKIFCWVNSGHDTDWQHVMAMAEDGTHLAGHISSSNYWAKRDIGYAQYAEGDPRPESKHKKYAEHYPDGYELEWIEHDQVRDHLGLSTAYEKNQQTAKEATASG